MFISDVVQKLELRGETEIPSHSIGEAVLEALEGFDKVAYVRFASVYKDFQNPDDFKRFISSLMREKV